MKEPKRRSARAPEAQAAPRPTASLLEAIDEVSRALARLKDELLTALAEPPEDVWVSQKETPLTKRAHCALARRLSAEGHPGASIAGRRHYLTRAVISEHLRGLPARAQAATPASVVAELERKLRGVRSGRTPKSVADELERKLRHVEGW